MYLLDTHIVLWLASNPEKLDTRTQDLLQQRNIPIYFSMVNLWEIAIKNKLGKADFLVDIHLVYQNLLEDDYRELPVMSKHCLALDELPLHHKDPFDRLLIAQAISEDLILITADTVIPNYNVRIF